MGFPILADHLIDSQALQVMGRAGADTYSAFFFPPTAVIAAFACARGGLEAFHQRDDWHQAPPSTDDERSLLIEDCDES